MPEIQTLCLWKSTPSKARAMACQQGRKTSDYCWWIRKIVKYYSKETRNVTAFRVRRWVLARCWNILGLAEPTALRFISCWCWRIIQKAPGRLDSHNPETVGLRAIRVGRSGPEICAARFRQLFQSSLSLPKGCGFAS